MEFAWASGLGAPQGRTHQLLGRRKSEGVDSNSPHDPVLVDLGVLRGLLGEPFAQPLAAHWGDFALASCKLEERAWGEAVCLGGQ